MDVNHLKRLKELEGELSQYIKIVAEQTLQITVLIDVFDKNLLGLLKSGASRLQLTTDRHYYSAGL